ncbi:MAG: hypothetical protein KDB27_30080 [Planctomycetales bacterium]|nr:hypothetical protein [Planctomycetales bacterium]
MPLIEANWNPSPRQLRQFGIICLIAIPLVAWFWFSESTQIIVIAAIAGGVAAVAGLVYPKTLLPLFVVLMVVATPIGMVVGELAMMTIYFLVFLPIGLLFRLMNRDRLDRSLQREASSYWMPKKRPSSLSSYYRQS